MNNISISRQIDVANISTNDIACFDWLVRRIEKDCVARQIIIGKRGKGFDANHLHIFEMTRRIWLTKPICGRFVPFNFEIQEVAFSPEIIKDICTNCLKSYLKKHR